MTGPARVEVFTRSHRRRRWSVQQKAAIVAESYETSVIAETIRYLLTRWKGLVMFVDDGHLELDTNPVERSMRPIALNRKNALFTGSDDGAEHWAILVTLTECCKLNGVNPADYLKDVICRLVNASTAT